jgi:hypothetical protein
MKHFCKFCVSLDDRGEYGLARSAIGVQQSHLSTCPFDDHGEVFFVDSLAGSEGG